MQTKSLQMVTDDFPPQLLDRLIHAVEGRMSQAYIIEKPLTAEMVAVHLNLCQRSIRKLVQDGRIKAHYFEGFKIPFYFPSEINETLKNSSWQFKREKIKAKK